jgi:hypothetical protein
MVTKDKENDRRGESDTEEHSRSDEMHDIDSSDVRDAGLAEQAEKTEERERATNEGNTQEPTFFAHETASLVAAVGVLPPEGGP